MNYDVFTTSDFEKYAKRLIRKYRSLKQEIVDLTTSLEKDLVQGTSLSGNCYKICQLLNDTIAISSGKAYTTALVYSNNFKK